MHAYITQYYYIIINTVVVMSAAADERDEGSDTRTPLGVDQ